MLMHTQTTTVTAERKLSDFSAPTTTPTPAPTPAPTTACVGGSGSSTGNLTGTWRFKQPWLVTWIMGTMILFIRNRSSSPVSSQNLAMFIPQCN